MVTQLYPSYPCFSCCPAAEYNVEIPDSSMRLPPTCQPIPAVSLLLFLISLCSRLTSRRRSRAPPSRRGARMGRMGRCQMQTHPPMSAAPSHSLPTCTWTLLFSHSAIQLPGGSMTVWTIHVSAACEAAGSTGCIIMPPLHQLFSFQSWSPNKDCPWTMCTHKGLPRLYMWTTHPASLHHALSLPQMFSSTDEQRQTSPCITSPLHD
jgi:hypothetical protein